MLGRLRKVVKFHGQEIVQVRQRDRLRGEVRYSDDEPPVVTGINLQSCGRNKPPPGILRSYSEPRCILRAESDFFMGDYNGKIAGVN